MSSRNPLDIAFGHAASGFKQFPVTGINTVGESTWYTLGPSLQDAVTNGGTANQLEFTDTAGQLSVTRANPGDTGKVAVVYLDDDYFERVARFDLSAGATATVDEFTSGTITARRVNQARYIGSGNLGAIDLKIGTGLVNRIGTDDGNARVCAYTTPRGQRVALIGWIAATQSGKPAELRLRAKLPGSKPYTLVTLPARETLESGILPLPRRLDDVDFTATPPTYVDYGIDIWVEARQPSGGTSGIVSAVLQLLALQTGEAPDAPGFRVL